MSNENYQLGTTLTVPRGVPNLQALTLDMTPVYSAEKRLHEIRAVSPGTRKELESCFNEACNTVSKYLAWVEYESLQAQKYLGVAKSTVVLDTAPEEFKKVKESGIKFNEDFREAVCMKDEEYLKRLDTLNAIKAVKALLEGKFWTFKRSYDSCATVADRKENTAAYPNLTTIQGAMGNNPVADFIGVRRSGT